MSGERKSKSIAFEIPIEGSQSPRRMSVTLKDRPVSPQISLDVIEDKLEKASERRRSVLLVSNVYFLVLLGMGEQKEFFSVEGTKAGGQKRN